MSRLVDATICPDCRATLDGQGTCSGCGLRLRGPLAGELWTAMVGADRLVEQLRLETAPVPAPQPAGPVGPPPAPTAPPTHPVRTTAPSPARRLPSASVPVVLLSLGALCLLVAAVVFIAVTWSLLGLTGRTLVLLGFTGLLSLVGVLLTRKGLRGAAETFWLVVAGMVTVDLLAASSAGLLGLDLLSWRGTSALVGGALVVLGVGVGTWARSQPVGRLYGAEVVVGIGVLVLCASNAWGATNPAVGTTVAIPLLVLLAALLWRPVPVAAYAVGGLAALSWLVLLGIGWDRILETAPAADWWADLRGWPLVVAALLAAVVVHAPRAPRAARPFAAALALLPLAALANSPATAGTPTRELAVACLTLAGLALVAGFGPWAWSRGAAALTALGTLVLGAALLVAPWVQLDELPTDGTAGRDLVISTMGEHPAAWTAGLAALTLVLSLACLLRQVPAATQVLAAQTAAALAAGAIALGGLVLVLELDPALWAGVLAGVVATAVAAAAAWSVRTTLVPGVVGSAATAYLAVVTLRAAAASHEAAALVATVFALALLVAFAVREREESAVAAATMAALAALLGGYAVVSWGLVLAASADERAVALSLYAALVGVLAAPITRRTAARVCLEAAALVLAVLSLGLPGDDRAAAMVLTVIGTALCLVAVLNRDRILAGWAGAAVLGVATVIRVAVDVRAPEVYTLPAAVLLLVAGVWLLRTEPGTSSITALGSGLTLALLPSLLLALDEPVSVRGAIVAVAAVVSLAVGVRLRLSAPFVAGALTTGVLALRHLEPIADAVPRWISLGLVGAILLAVGVTWEARRRNLTTAGRYLTALR